MERYTTGLLTDLPRKSAADMGRSLFGTNSQRLQEFLARTAWDSRDMDRLRISHMMGTQAWVRRCRFWETPTFARRAGIPWEWPASTPERWTGGKTARCC